MIDERTLELINIGIDGELSADEEVELTNRLQQSEEARRHQASLREMDKLLAALPEHDVSADLHRKIIGSVSLPSNSSRSSSLTRNLGATPAFLRYGLAAAAGLLLVVGVYETRPGSPDQPDLNSMIGTMAPSSAGKSTLDTYTLEELELRSSVSLEQRDGATVLHVTLESDDAIDFSIDLSAAGLRFDALAQLQSQLESFHIAGQVIRARSRGRQRFAVLLHRIESRSDKDAIVRLEYSRNGMLVQQGSLDPDG